MQRTSCKMHDESQTRITAAAKSLQSCPTLCDPTDGSPTGSPVPWILQARTLEWVAISCSNAFKWKVKVKSLSPVRPSVTPWTAAYQAHPSMGFSRQEYWSGVPLLYRFLNGSVSTISSENWFSNCTPILELRERGCSTVQANIQVFLQLKTG